MGEVGATPKLLSLGIQKMGKETTGIISDGVCWKPGLLCDILTDCLSNTTNNFAKFSFVWAQELKIPKMTIFRRCPEIAGKAETGGKFMGEKPKKLIILNQPSILSPFIGGTLLQNIYILDDTVYTI